MVRVHSPRISPAAIVAVILSTLASPVPAAAHVDLAVTSGFTSERPVIDGILQSGEWQASTSFTFPVLGFGRSPGTVYVMHDETDLFIALAMPDDQRGLNGFRVTFDDNHNDVLDTGEDMLTANLGDSGLAFDSYFDAALFSTWWFDSTDGGTKDIDAAGQYSFFPLRGATFEVQHPLCSADQAHDVCLEPGQTAGITFNYAWGAGESVAYPLGFGDLTIPLRQDTTPPALTLPGDITLDGVAPEGAIAEYSASAVDDEDGPLVPTCIPPSGSTFPIGTTNVSCSATDAAGNTGSGTFAVHVLGVVPQLDNLAAAISALGRRMPNLEDKVATILKFVLADKHDQACENIAAFEQNVASMIGGRLTATEAANLLLRTAHISGAYACVG
jgi:hypothetical protein